MRSQLVLFVFFITVCTAGLYSQTPTTLSMQGVLRDASGSAVADGSYAMTFNIYTAATGGSSVWTETQSAVAVQNGVFNVQLGSVTPFGSLAFTQQYWIGVTTGGIEMSPRITLTAAPYAMGFKGSSNVFGSSGNVGIGSLSPENKLTVAGGVKADTVIATVKMTSVGLVNTGGADLSGNTVITGTLTNNGNATISGTLTTTGNTTVGGKITADTLLATAGKLTLTGGTSIAGSLTISDSIGIGNSNPTEKLDVTGNIKSGTQFVPVANAGVRMIFGKINSAGTIISGSGDFTISHPATGVYVITMNSTPTTVYSITVTLINEGATASSDFQRLGSVWGQSGNQFSVSTQGAGGANMTNNGFYFTAIVSRDNVGL